VRASHRPWRLAGLDGARVHVVDMLDRAAVDALLSRTRPSWILHLAAYGAYASQSDVALCVRTNVEASVDLDGGGCGATASSASSTPGARPSTASKTTLPTKTSPTEPNSLYAVTKVAATAYARYLAQTSRLHTTTLRLYSVYGPYEEPTAPHPNLGARGPAGNISPAGLAWVARDFVYVDDVVRAYAAVLGADVPSGGSTTSYRRADQLGGRRRGQPFVLWDRPAARLGDDAAANVGYEYLDSNIGRVRREVGWRPETSFEEGFRRTAECGCGARPARTRTTRLPEQDRNAL